MLDNITRAFTKALGALITAVGGAFVSFLTPIIIIFSAIIVFFGAIFATTMTSTSASDTSSDIITFDSSAASDLWGEITLWERENNRLSTGGATVDIRCLMAYALFRYPGITADDYESALEDVRSIYDGAASEGMLNNIRGYLSLHAEELFPGGQYNEFIAFLNNDPFESCVVFASPFPDHNWKQYITSKFGWRVFPLDDGLQAFDFHATDVAGGGIRYGTEVSSIMDSQVYIARNFDHGGYGKYVETRKIVEIDGRRQIISVIYGHLSDVYVSVGDVVGAGDVIGTVGSTGMSTGSHLHLEITIGGKKVCAELVCAKDPPQDEVE